MLNSITSVKDTNNISFQRRKSVNYQDITTEKPNKDSGKKILLALGGLAVMGAAYCAVTKRNPFNNHLNVIEFLKNSGEKRIEKTFKFIPQRDSAAVGLYNSMKAQNKALVLEYKLKNKMFEGKSTEVIAQIQKNLEKLRGSIK